jgi:hypothetical protein
MPWGTEQETEPTYRPWGTNPHLTDWDQTSEAWLDYRAEHRNDEAEDGDEIVQVKKHKRKVK